LIKVPSVPSDPIFIFIFGNCRHNTKVLMQGKLFQRCTHFLYCSVLSLDGKVNTRRMSQPGINFHKNNLWNIWNILVIGNYYVNFQKFLNEMLISSSDTRRTLNIYSCLQIPPRENWFQYVRRVYATAINFPCISTVLNTKN